MVEKIKENKKIVIYFSLPPKSINVNILLELSTISSQESIY